MAADFSNHGLWYFPPVALARARREVDPDKVVANLEKRNEMRRRGYEQARSLVNNLAVSGADQGILFEQQAYASLSRRLDAQSNRCPHCWHDRLQRCICTSVGGNARLTLNVRVLVLIHHKEFGRASDDAKLLLMMLPPEQQKLFIFGRPGDLEAMMEEVDRDPDHALMLWPGDGALTVDGFLRALPATSAWRRRPPDDGSSSSSNVAAGASSTRPVLRVVVLDAVYRAARRMFRHLQKQRLATNPSHPLQHVALHPTTLSVYSRAQHGYAQASAQSTAQSADPAALRICTVEAFALLLEELGEPPTTTRRFVDAVIINNRALHLAS